VRRAKKRGVHITCDTAPHYFALTEEAVLGYRTFAKVNPPLRSEADRLAVIAALQDGTIDAIVSDHCPQDQDSKRVPFAQAANGAVGFETLFAATLELVHQQKLSLLEALKPLTCAPADILRLKVGRIARRHAADFILFDPNHTWTLDPAHLKSKSKNTLFGEHQFKGRVLATIKAGKKVYSVGE
jgi:dihydroorotase